ncbi:MAG: hypothetical protein SAJ12_22050 [Jaaginema sp. PMC 1079.18]|nr:hypothetical protein [Jaaginema sp. PMC 1080.18]MEC4853674.1 hypothetical protein [Jaaginema sp. PMC 1079.18]MEC4867840.1 hypothetical protein [Jaaginema sp. PMC 1078.18]
MLLTANLISLYLVLFAVLLLGGLSLQALPALGQGMKPLRTSLTQGFGLDLAVAYFTLFPPVLGIILAGWRGLGVAVIAQISAMLVWVLIDELRHKSADPEAKIHLTLSKIVGSWRNHLAVWITALAVPTFWVVRFSEWIVYPPLTVLVKLPRYNAHEWINVSRQKFAGLVGYDLIWCLYCDWMTGVWSLGTEMLRNVESFWCPIRFSSEKKCENCKIDFPDVNNSWVKADGSMKEVTTLLENKYSQVDECSWHGHPNRLNVTHQSREDF